jgi:putative ABC transport system substrate-binding protein
MNSKRKIIFLLIVAFILPAKLLAQSTEIAVIRTAKSPFYDSIYFAFAASAGKRFITFDAKLGQEASIAKSLRLQEVRVVFVVGEPNQGLIDQIDAKLPIVFIGHGGLITESVEGRALIRLDAELGASQILEVLAKVFPTKKRIGMVYNPKLTKKVIDRFRAANRDAARRLVLLKVDQPADVANLMPTFNGKIDMFLLIRDATVVKAGIQSIGPFLRQNSLPLVAPTRAFAGNGSLMTVEIDPMSIGRIAGEVTRKALAGQRTFKVQFEPADFELRFSLEESFKLKMPAEQFIQLLDRATAAGYRVHINQ